MATVRCPECGQPVDEWARSCSSCDHPVAAALRESHKVERGRPADQPTERVPRVQGPGGAARSQAGLPPVPCPSCGATNRGSRAQCERCGEPLSPAAVRTAEQQRPGGARTLVPTPVLVLVALSVAAAAVYFLAFSGRGGDGDAPTEASAPSEAADGGAEPEAPAEPASQTYVVAEGDSLSSIAQRFGVTVEALAVANGIDDPDVITLGQELVIPGPVPASPAPS